MGDASERFNNNKDKSTSKNTFDMLKSKWQSSETKQRREKRNEAERNFNEKYESLKMTEVQIEYTSTKKKLLDYIKKTNSGEKPGDSILDEEDINTLLSKHNTINKMEEQINKELRDMRGFKDSMEDTVKGKKIQTSESRGRFEIMTRQLGECEKYSTALKSLKEEVSTEVRKQTERKKIIEKFFNIEKKLNENLLRNIFMLDKKN